MAEISVTIAGRSFRLACADGDEARANELAAFVKSKVEQLTEAHGQVGVDRLLLMAAMMTADDLLDRREQSARTSDTERGADPSPDPTRKAV